MADVREKMKSGIDTAADSARTAVDRGAEQAKSGTDRTAGIVGQVKHKAEDAVDAIGGFASDAGDRRAHV